MKNNQKKKKRKRSLFCSLFVNFTELPSRVRNIHPIHYERKIQKRKFYLKSNDISTTAQPNIIKIISFFLFSLYKNDTANSGMLLLLSLSRKNIIRQHPLLLLLLLFFRKKYI